MRRIHEKISHFIQNKRLTKYLNNPWYLAAITSLVLLLSVVICSYRQCWRHVGSAHNDISVALTEYSNAFYSNKYHIWYESFHAYGLLLFLLTPLVMACVYSNQYYDKSDVYQVYRKGFLHYYAAKFGKALSVSAVLSGAAMLLFWTGLCVFAHGTGVYIEDTGFIPEAYVIPSITIVNESVKNTARFSLSICPLYLFDLFPRRHELLYVCVCGSALPSFQNHPTAAAHRRDNHSGFCDGYADSLFGRLAVI